LRYDVLMPRRYTLSRCLQTVWIVGWSDFVLKYHGSVLGYLWSLIGPLVKFIVIYYVTRPFVDAAIPNYPLYLFLGLIIFEHFCNTTTGCVSMLLNKESIISKMSFPRILLILIIGWSNLIVYLTYLLVFVAFSILLGVIPTVQYLQIPLLLLQMTLVALGVGMLISAYSLKFRDTEHLWALILYVLFWLTPIFYQYRLDAPLSVSVRTIFADMSIAPFHAFFNFFIHVQPLSILINDSRRILLYPDSIGAPTATHTIVFTGMCMAVFLIGARVFQSRSRFFVEEY